MSTAKKGPVTPPPTRRELEIVEDSPSPQNVVNKGVMIAPPPGLYDAPAPVPATAPVPAPAPAPKDKEEKKRHQGIYMQNVLVRKVHLDINEIGGNIAANLEKKLRREIESKCIKEGYVKPRSTKVLSYSCGVLRSNKVEFVVTFECLVCRPVEGMKIFKCVAKNITKAGIRAELRTEGDEPSPIVVFVARDHHYDNKYFATIKEEDEINVRVIGQRYELNDTYVSIIAEILEPKEKAAAVSYTVGEKKKVKLNIVE
jgi:DNA-directed RNA polymerase subunit E'/Rpb7